MLYCNHKTWTFVIVFHPIHLICLILGYINRLFAHNLTRRNVKQIKRIKSNQIEKQEKGAGQ